MSSRQLVRAVVAASGMLALSACNPSSPAPAPVATVTVTASPSGAVDSAVAQPSATAKPAAGSPAAGSPAAALNQAAKDCKPGEGPTPMAGHRVIVLTKPITGGTVRAKYGEYECEMPDQGWWPKGDEKAFALAADAKAELANNGDRRPVSLARLADHTVKCLSNDRQDPDSPCDSGVDYDITLSASGQIVAISEIWPS